MGRKPSQLPSAPEYAGFEIVTLRLLVGYLTLQTVTKPGMQATVDNLPQPEGSSKDRVLSFASLGSYASTRINSLRSGDFGSERNTLEFPVSGMPDPSNHFVGYQHIFENECDIFTATTLRVFLAAASTPDTLALNVQQIKQIASQLIGNDGPRVDLRSLGSTHGNIYPLSVVLSAPIYTNCVVFHKQTGDFDWVDALSDNHVQILFYGDVRDKGVMIGTDQYTPIVVVIPDSGILARGQTAQLLLTEKADHFSLGCLIEMVLCKPIFPRVEGSADYA
ncbi:hypothetical protein FA13DRAFT_1711573 [Coprinellus micaceus]|uniref:Uncharacterized protein n=1 Tax=Coprinellus micaceus TaxID=71717 RepID=A0A4Y7T4M1_COPMI|nr:hypothetical protein FA13DRAFT_1711573 [Coprinellus micaceus]